MVKGQPAKPEYPEVRPPRSPLVKVARSGVHGRGLFAAQRIKKGERIMQYGGVKVPRAEGRRRTEKQWARGRVYVFELNQRYDLDGSPTWNIARLANHSCDPNAESQNERGRAIWIVATRDIEPGEEITYDYNFPFEEDPLPCKCGARNCRGYVVGHEYVAELQEWLRQKGEAAVAG
jgi:uncharacterized protein